jgi:cobalamin biosynthesis protein CobC
VVLRSFGKTYGLAGLRLGFALAVPEIARVIAATLGPWAVSGPALAIGRAALSDRAWLARTAAERAAEAGRLDRMLVRAGCAVIGGTSLFRLARCPDAPGLFRRLGAAGIHVRRFEARPDLLRFGLPAGKEQWCRLSRVLKPDGSAPLGEGEDEGGPR